MTRYSLNGQRVSGGTFTVGCLLLVTLFCLMVALMGGVLALLVNAVFGAGTFTFGQGVAALILVAFAGRLLGLGGSSKS